MSLLIGMPSADSWGGPISSEPPFIDALRSRGLHVTTSDYVFGDKEKPTRFFSRVSRVIKTALRFRSLLRQRDFDLIHLNTAFDTKTILRDSFSIFVMQPRGVKLFLKLHGSNADEFLRPSWIIRKLIGFLQRRVDGYGYHTREELLAFSAIGFDERKFFPVRNAVTIRDRLPAAFVRRHKPPDQIFEIIFASRFIPAKGLLETIEACAEIRKRGFRIRLSCIGDGESRRAAEDAVGRLALGRAVTFTGYIPESEVSERLIDADIFVFPTSHAEGFPNILFKAVAVGLPIVTTAVRASVDHLSEPINCLYCSKDPEDIADKIELLINDVDLRERMSRANLEYGRSLEPDRIAGEFIEIYKRLID